MYESSSLLDPGGSARPPSFGLPPRLRKPRLRRNETSEYLRLVYGIQVAPATLAKWACYGEGPAMQGNRTRGQSSYAGTGLQGLATDLYW
jgi:hypothetical protein